MKVLYITVRADFGGGPRHVTQLINNLSEKYEIYLAAPYGEPYGTEWRCNKNLKGILTIPYRSFSIKTLFQINHFIKEHKIDIIHSHGNGAGIYSRLLKILCPKVKIIHTFHGISDNYSSKFKNITNIIIGNILKFFTDKFILVSNGEMKLGKQLGFIKSKTSEVIYNGIEDHGKKNLIHSHILNIVTLSRFDYAKNMDMAFAIARFFKKDNSITFTWVGDGDDFQRLKEQAINENLNINFVGFSKEPIKFLKEADIYLSTSRFEGLPYALIEAASVGIPIIATNVKGNNECVKNKETGLLFTTIEQGISCIQQLQDYNIRKRLGDNARDFFLNTFTEEQMITKIINVYENK